MAVPITKMPSQRFEITICIDLSKFLSKVPPFFLDTLLHYFLLVALSCRCGINAKLSTLDFYLLELCQEMNTNYCLPSKHLHSTSYVPGSVLSVLQTLTHLNPHDSPIHRHYCHPHLHLGKQKHREGKELNQGHTASE